MRISLIFLGLLLSFGAAADDVYAKAEVVRTYYASGATKAEFLKENGKLNGPSKWYYQDGALGALLTYRDNQLHGLTQTYYQTGQVKKQVLMKRNKPVGLTHYFSQDGKLEKVEVLQSGKAKAQWTYGETEDILLCEELGDHEPAQN